MCRSLHTAAIITALASLHAGAEGAPPLPLREGPVASREIVSRYSAIFESPPRQVPSFKIVDGPIIGNGDIGLTVSGPPECQCYWISKNDFWKSGPNFKQCGPSLIGGLDIRIEQCRGAAYHVEQHLYEAAITSKFVRGEAVVELKAQVAATDNVLVLSLRASGKPVRVNLNLWAKQGYGSQTGSGRDGAVFWVTRKFDAADLLYPTAATIAMRCLESDAPDFVLAPGKPVTVVGSIMTNHESERYHSRVREKVALTDHEAVGHLQVEHELWWQDFWAKSWVHIEDQLIEKYYYASLYIMACCSRNANFPPGLYGNWITSDRTAWAGDIHLNYNHEAPFWALYSANRLELTDPYDAPMLEHIAIFREDAAHFLKTKGLYASVGIGPRGLNSRFFDPEGMTKVYGNKDSSGKYQELAGQPMFLGQKSNALFAGMNMLLRYFYTYDEIYLRKVYPYLSGVADFWEDYLRFENGRYVIYNDSYEEVGPWQGEGWYNGYGDMNPINSLGFLRVFFKAMVEFSETLGRDPVRREAWRNILAHLSELPVCDDQGRQRFRACEGGTGSGKNIVGLEWQMLHGLVYPAPNIGLGSDARLLKMIRDDMSEWGDRTWLDHGNAFQTVFIGAVRVGFDPEFLMAKAREKIKKHSYPNLWIYADGGGIETCSGIPGMLNEMMLQSHNGVIRIFPVFPAKQQASFYRLRTFGAFLVSSALRNGQVQPVVIESEQGRVCRIRNPWPGKVVSVHRAKRAAETMTGEDIVLKTERGERLVLAPEGVKAASVNY